MTKILSIETSCDETAISVLKGSGSIKAPKFEVLGNALFSQVALHAEYGGVFPNLAKREHSRRIIPLLEKALKDAGLLKPLKKGDVIIPKITYLEREPEAKEALENFFLKYQTPKIDVTCVTSGPGLEPALWVGINVARALASAWDVPIVPTNHMEGHVTSILLKKEELKSRFQNSNLKIQSYKTIKVKFPAVALLVSGGHTELHYVEGWTKYKLLGATKDDAVGEAFDKTARLLGLPYPGGPEISRLAEAARHDKLRIKNEELGIKLPRPMLHSGDYDFSFSGLKTAVRYLVRDLEKEHSDILENVGMKAEIAKEFEDAAIEVLVTKTIRAVKEFSAKSVIVGGGVAANNYLRMELARLVSKEFGNLPVLFPEKDLSTDNSVMIGIAGYLEYLKNGKKGADITTIKANGNLKI